MVESRRVRTPVAAAADTVWQSRGTGSGVGFYYLCSIDPSVLVQGWVDVRCERGIGGGGMGGDVEGVRMERGWEWGGEASMGDACVRSGVGGCWT